MSGISGELYFLIAKFLAGGPCEKAAEVLIGELEKHEIIPKSVNWLGESFPQDYKTFSSKFSHIQPDQLLKLLEHLLGSINSKESPSTSGAKSLLSSRTTSLLLKSGESAHRNGDPFPSKSGHRLAPNLVSSILGRELSGNKIGTELLRPDFYSRFNLSCRTLGHLSAVYCVLFDMTGKFIFTGADDKLVKVWGSTDGRLLATLRGSHQDNAEITDLAVNYENTLLAASSCDKVIRIWCLRTGSPLVSLTGHGGTVSSIYFCPLPSTMSTVRYLGSTSTDGSCAFWAYTEEPGRQAVFQAKPTLYLERMRPGHAQMICASFSAGGVFMAAGSADFNVRVYYMLGQEGPERILEVEVHTDRVDSISWSHRGVKFISGSKDGTALVWRWQNQQWRYVKIQCSKPCPGDPIVDPRSKTMVTMVGWNADDSLVLTALHSGVVRVWNPSNGNLVRVLRDHRNEAYVVETHPTNPRIVCTAAHDGNIFIWDIGTKDDPDQQSGNILFSYHNSLDGQGYGAIFDVKWSPDALCLAATDSHGNLLIFNCGDNSKFDGLPKELFFHTDYRPLIMDAMTHEVLDEQTQVAPHLMPPPFLVDVDGNPYPPKLQRLVPGRESCKEEQLIPNVAVAPTGFQEVIEGLPILPGSLNPRSNIDQMIEQLAAAQGVPGENEDNGGRRNSGRRSAEGEGVRHSTGNWQTTGVYRYFKRNVVTPLSSALLARQEEIRHGFALEEDQYYQEHKTKKAPGSTNSPGLPISPTGNLSNRDIKSRRLRRLAAQAAERRRQEELSQIDEEEGIARPNPPQQEISMPQERTMAPRRPPRARPTASTGNRARRPRRARYTVPRPLLNGRESEVEQAMSAGDTDSEFSSSDAGSGSSSSSSESDWGGAPSGTPKKGPGPGTSSSSNRRRTARNQSNSNSPPGPSKSGGSDEDYEEPKPGPSSQVTKTIKTESVSPVNRPRRVKKRAIVEDGGLEEIEEKYRPSEWLSEVMPRRNPYFPQLGDDLIYLRQGHEMYISEVQAIGIYPLSKKDMKTLPYVAKPELPAEVPVRVVSIKFELKPPRLVSLKLSITDWETGELTGANINVVYHDVPDVVDFLVLRQVYNKSMRRKWNIKDRFRCLIDKEWWLGTIKGKEPHSPQFPDSKFMCYQIDWDNSGEEKMSPWDIELITDDFEIPKEGTLGNSGIPASEADLRSGMYEVNEMDWPPHGHQDAECLRLKTIIENVMELAIAEPFLTPVDLNKYPSYAYEVEYPVDLSTIKTRLENHFYRRLDSVKFDVTFIALNTEKFNQPRSNIVRQARIIKDICLQVMSQAGATEVTQVYRALNKNFKWGESDEDSHEKAARRKSRIPDMNNLTNGQSELSQEPSCSSTRTSTRLKQRGVGRVRRKGNRDGDDESRKPWQERCKDLLNKIWSNKDSVPFREPVDPIEYPDYHHQIDTPMDLQSVREDLLGNNYQTPQAFVKDMQLIFINSRIYNTDKHSQIHIMTIRIQALFESLAKSILDDNKCRRSRSTHFPKTRSTDKINGSGATPSRNASVAGTSRHTKSITTSGHNIAVASRNGSAASTPRKNPRRSAAAKNPYVANDDSNDDLHDSSSEPVADEESYRDTRTRRKRRTSTPGTSAGPSKRRRETSSHPVSPSSGPSSARQVKKLKLESSDGETPSLRIASTPSKKGGFRHVKPEPADYAEESEENEDIKMPNLKKVDSDYEESSFSEEDDHDHENGSRFQKQPGRQGRGMKLRNRSSPNNRRRDAGTDEEHSGRGPKTRYRGKAARNYDETGNISDATDHSEAALTLADRVKKSRRGSGGVTNGYRGNADSDSGEEESGDNYNVDELPGPSSRVFTRSRQNSVRRSGRRVIQSDADDEHLEEEETEENIRNNDRQKNLRNSRKAAKKLSSDDDGDGEDYEDETSRRKPGRGKVKNGSPKSKYNTRRKGPVEKDHEFEEESEDETEDEEDGPEYHAVLTKSRRAAAGTKTRKGKQKGTSDEDEESSPLPRRTRKSPNRPGTSLRNSPKRPTRGHQKLDYAEDSDEEEETGFNVSSRGRIRRRKSFLGE